MESDDNNNKSEQFLSIVMSLQYLTNTRPDICLTVSYLCTRSRNPTKLDWIKLQHLLNYINRTSKDELVLKPKDLKLTAYIDASYNVHPNAKSHSGVVLSLGEMDESNACTIFASSNKQKLVTRSSFEAELVAVENGLDQIIFNRQLLIDLNITINQTDPITLYQDNKSTLYVCTEQSPYIRAKHINTRYYWVRDKVEDKTIQMKYTPSEFMIADAFTKPIVGSRFKYLKSIFMNNIY